MLRKIENKKMGRSNLGWLKSIFHFSFAEYYNPDNMNFGVLRVLNDDIIEPGTGFDTHPHRNMEIVSYVVDGELTHGDSMGNTKTLTRGQVQYMSAGTGVFHSEFNYGDKPGRFLQIWILPDNNGYEPNYGDYEFEWNQRKNKWLHLVSRKTGNAPIKINQDVNLYTLELDTDKEIIFPVKEGRQAYLIQIEGTSYINNIGLDAKDALEITEEIITIKPNATSHYLLIEMSKS
ncbi:pirin family protein [Clostridium swellfunianum]|uniref:pirin family protein n=1 Tax=Clostridium swellfunianum TaxID=1367462 RepID=UPI00203047BB|nr:pirin family protein [Clostridium swellfunianum]MCM0649681.1 pirin family protein [Clostridium swellfunianum]